jgi:hypothetical protein
MTDAMKALSIGGTPILALDMYEHAYRIDRGAKAADAIN